MKKLIAKLLSTDVNILATGVLIGLVGLMYAYWRGSMEQELRDLGIFITFLSLIYISTIFFYEKKGGKLLSLLIYFLACLTQVIPISLWLTNNPISDHGILPPNNQLYSIPHILIALGSALNFMNILRKKTTGKSERKNVFNVAKFILIVLLSIVVHYLFNSFQLRPNYVIIQEDFIPPNNNDLIKFGEIKVKTE